jgi:hypothetical protein
MRVHLELEAFGLDVQGAQLGVDVRQTRGNRESWSFNLVLQDLRHGELLPGSRLGEARGGSGRLGLRRARLGADACAGKKVAGARV